jgi:DNA modification methylase
VKSLNEEGKPVNHNTTNVQEVQQLIAAAQPFEEWYLSLQGHFPHIQLEPSNDTIPLVTGQNNVNLPIHRWYNLKESFAADLPIWLCHWMKDHYQHTPGIILDPFLGSATTGISLAQLNMSVTGVEYNPFIYFAAATKAAITQACSIEIQEAIHRIKNINHSFASISVPSLSTLHNPKYSDERDIKVLLAMHNLINQLDISLASRAMLHIGIAATVDSIFHLRKDGRALRYALKTSNRSVHDSLTSHWQIILHDIEQYHSQNSHHPAQQPLFNAYKGSAINLQILHTFEGKVLSLANNSFDTIIYSPPYLNNFDYSEIYKIELWLLKFIESYDEWKTLRLGTLRSHHSIAFPETQHLANNPRTQAIAAHIKKMGASPCLPQQERGRIKREIEGYFDDMYLALCEQWRVLKPGGILAYVVANSRHYYLPIATDVIIAEIARSIGFELLDLVVLRKRNGRTRQKLFLRESAVFLMKPFHTIQPH